MSFTETKTVLAAELVNFKPDIEKLYIDPAVIRVGIGYPLNHTDKQIDHMIDEVIAGATKRLEMVSGYQIFSEIHKDQEQHSLTIGGKVFNTERIIYAQMRKADAVAIFLCTIGPQMEHWSKELIDNGDYLHGYIVDAVASEATEQAVEQTHNHLEAQMRDIGLGITNRFSPGYCNWPVKEQHKLFSLLPPGFCGITLTESALMMPIKSVSGIIGIGSDVKRLGYACKMCNDKNCIYRKIKS